MQNKILVSLDFKKERVVTSLIPVRMHDLAGLQEELFTLVQDPSNKDILLKEYFNKVFDIFQSIEPSHLTLEQSKVYFVEAVELFHAFRSLPFTELSFSIIQQLILLITSFSLNFNELLPVAIEEFESLLFTDSQELLILTVDSTNEILDNFYEFIWQNFLTLVVKIVEKGKSHSNKPYLALISMASTRLSQLTFISDLEYLDPSQSSYKILKVILILASFLKNPKVRNNYFLKF